MSGICSKIFQGKGMRWSKCGNILTLSDYFTLSGSLGWVPQSWLRYKSWEVTRGTWPRLGGRQRREGSQRWRMGFMRSLEAVLRNCGAPKDHSPREREPGLCPPVLDLDSWPALSSGCLSPGTGPDRTLYLELQRLRAVDGAPWPLL